jgi:hypothetical protein
MGISHKKALPVLTSQVFGFTLGRLGDPVPQVAGIAN